MSHKFVLLGFLTWLVSTFYKIFLWSRSSIGWKSIWKAVSISLKSDGIIFTFSVLQMIGGFWIAIGVFFQITGEEIIKGFYGSLVVAGLFLIPIWIAAAIMERKNKRR